MRYWTVISALIYLQTTTGLLTQELPPQSDSHFTGFALFEYKELHDAGKTICTEIYDGTITMFRGVIGRLAVGDCAALYYLTTMRALYTKITLQRDFYYVETGSFLGLSANVVAQALDDTEAPGIIYSHDLFDMAHAGTSQYVDGSIWNIVHEIYGSDIKSHLRQFYINVQRNNNTHRIIPISGTVYYFICFRFIHIGYSSDTLRIHASASVDIVFIDGDHTYQGVNINFVPLSDG